MKAPVKRIPVRFAAQGFAVGCQPCRGAFPPESKGASIRVVAVKSLGQHLILEMNGCDAALLDNLEHVGRAMNLAVRNSGATTIKPFFHQFAPQGVSGVVVISESHFSIHTWPEYGYAAVDIFTCGDCIDMDIAVETLRDEFRAGSLQKMMLTRGSLDLPDRLIKHKPHPEEPPDLKAVV